MAHTQDKIEDRVGTVRFGMYMQGGSVYAFARIVDRYGLPVIRVANTLPERMLTTEVDAFDILNRELAPYGVALTDAIRPMLERQLETFYYRGSRPLVGIEYKRRPVTSGV